MTNEPKKSTPPPTKAKCGHLVAEGGYCENCGAAASEYRPTFTGPRPGPSPVPPDLTAEELRRRWLLSFGELDDLYNELIAERQNTGPLSPESLTLVEAIRQRQAHQGQRCPDPENLDV